MHRWQEGRPRSHYDEVSQLLKLAALRILSTDLDPAPATKVTVSTWLARIGHIGMLSGVTLTGRLDTSSRPERQVGVPIQIFVTLRELLEQNQADFISHSTSR